ncbi:MAG: sugar ABC transporter permease [Thermomicrobiales bacterium]|nr:sugar ABC transporter permease [Thermomicrobiales bacterium]
MVLPTVLVLLAVSIYPFLYMIRMSFFEYSPLPQVPSKFVGLGNWVQMLQDQAIWASWLTTAWYFGAALTLQLVLGVAIALLIEHTPYFRDALATILLSPMFVAPVLVGLLWRFLLHDSYGVYTYFLHEIGLLNNVSILGDPRTAMPAVVLMDTWEWTPLVVIVVLSGLRALPHDVLEASVVDGSSYWQQVRYITLPMLRPVILVAALIRSMDLLRYIDHLMVTTAGGPADSTKIIGIRIFEEAFRFFRLGYASALGLAMIVVTIFLGRLFVNVLGEEQGAPGA